MRVGLTDVDGLELRLELRLNEKEWTMECNGVGTAEWWECTEKEKRK